jgi:hypothetical protein
VLSSAQILSHQKADRISVPNTTVVASKLWSGHDRAQSVFSNEDDWAPIGIRRHFPVP